MPYKRKDSQVWWISWYAADGKQSRQAVGTDYAQAKALEQKLKAQVHEDKKRGETDRRLDTVLAAYLTTRITGPNRSAAKHLLALADRWVGDLNSKVIRQYIRDREDAGAKPGTINKELGIISAAVNQYNLDHNLTLRNPIKGLKLREPEGRLRWLTRQEYDRLIASCDGYLRDFIILAVMTGMRKGELLTLQFEQIDMERKLLHLRPEDTKTKKGRTIPLNHDAMAAIERRSAECQTWVFCSPYSGKQGEAVKEIKRGFAAACKKAGLTGVSPHILRHTCASWLVQAGVPLYEVAKVLGHSSTVITQRYSHLAPDHLRGAVDALSRA